MALVNTPPRIAVGILAHDHPDLLDALVQRLVPDFSIYLHLDRASKLDPQHFTWVDQVTLIKRRRCHWGSFNVTRAIIDFLHQANSQGFDHYLLVSGQDLALKSNQEILDFFSQNRGTDFIQSLPLPSPVLRGGIERITRVYWQAPYRHTGVKRAFYNVVEYALELGYRTMLQPKVLSGKFFWGETWFALTHQTIQGVVNYLDQNPDFIRLFRGSRLGEELFLQTLVRRVSPPATLATDTITYVDWSNGTHGSPKTLDEEDLGALMQTQHLFARKIHPVKSQKLIEAFRKVT